MKKFLENDQIIPNTISHANYLKNLIISKKLIVVDQAGGGDYVDIASAVAAGHKRIFVKEGRYTLLANLDLIQTSLIGESPATTIIDLNTFNISIKSTAQYNTGTATVVGSSTEIQAGGAASWSGAAKPSSYLDPWFISDELAAKLDPALFTDTRAYITPNNNPGGAYTAINYEMQDNPSIGSNVSGFRIEGDGQFNVSGISNNVFNCVFMKAAGGAGTSHIEIGISGEAAYLTKITNCHFFGAEKGIILSNAPFSYIVDCTFAVSVTAVKAVGISLTTNNLFIIRSKFYDSNTGANACVEISDTAGIKIIDCIFRYVRGYDIIIDTCTDVWIEGCNFYSRITTATISIINTSIIHFCKNTIEATTLFSTDADCQDIFITDNVMGDEPISFLSKGNLSICNNQFSPSVMGGNISITNSANGTVFSNNIVVGRCLTFTGNEYNICDNLLINTPNTATAAIKIIGNHNIISGNLLENPALIGIGITGDYNTVSSNIVYSSGGDGIVVVLGALGRNIVAANIINDPTGDGIEITSGPAVVSGNIIYSASAKGIYLVNADNISMCGNCADGCLVGAKIDNTSDRVAAVGNVLYTNTTNLTNNGTNTDFAHNIIA
jgi:hypothetical protein